MKNQWLAQLVSKTVNPIVDFEKPTTIWGRSVLRMGFHTPNMPTIEEQKQYRQFLREEEARKELVKNLATKERFSTNDPKITGDDVLYVSNAYCGPRSLRLHLKKGGYVELSGTADEIADKINELFVRGRNAS